MRRKDLPDNAFLVSRSRLGVWNTCQFKHDLMYNKGLERQGNSTPQLRLGTIVHDHWQAYYDYWLGQPVGFLSAAEVQSIMAPLHSREMLYDDQLYHWRAGTLLMRYSDYSAVNDPFIALETELEIFADLEMKTPDGRPIYLQAILDLLFDMDGLVGFLDHKTSAQKAWTYDMAYFDNQLAFYIIVLWLSGIHMDVAMINNINTYNYVNLSKIKDEKLFSRVSIFPDKLRYDAYLSNIKTMIRQLLNIRFPPQNLDKHCQWCPFKNICESSLHGLDTKPFVGQMAVPSVVFDSDELI